MESVAGSIAAAWGRGSGNRFSQGNFLQLGYKLGFVDDAAVWLLMLKKRNTSVHIYDEDEVDEMILLIRDSFIPAFIRLCDTLKVKAAEAENDWN